MRACLPCLTTTFELDTYDNVILDVLVRLTLLLFLKRADPNMAPTKTEANPTLPRDG